MLKIDTIIPGLEVPNLDCLSDDDLHSAQLAFDRLRGIAQALASARRYRRLGALLKAKQYENEAEGLYRSLPQSMRW